MKEFYSLVGETNKIIIATPIYFDTITGILKNVIDRWMPLYVKEGLKGKEIYLITIGEMSEEENEIAVNRIKDYFNYLAETFNFNFYFLRNFTTIKNDTLKDNYSNYKEIVEILNIKINNN